MLKTLCYAWHKAFEPMTPGGPDNNVIYLCGYMLLVAFVALVGMVGLVAFVTTMICLNI